MAIKVFMEADKTPEEFKEKIKEELLISYAKLSKVLDLLMVDNGEGILDENLTKKLYDAADNILGVLQKKKWMQ
jgi:hypothetical protein